MMRLERTKAPRALIETWEDDFKRVKEQLMAFIEWMYTESDFHIVRDSEFPYYGDLSHEDLEAIVDDFLKEKEQ
jgi:hypothetical protein